MIQFENGNYFSYDMIGEFHAAGAWIHPRRIIKSFELIFVLDGTVHIAESDIRYTLQKNQMMILEPGKEHYGYKTVHTPTAFYWFHFFTDLPVAFKQYTGDEVYEIKQLCKKLLHITNTPAYPASAADATGYLILEEMARLAESDIRTNRLLIAKITEYIRLHLKEGITVADIAQHLGYNADYIGKYFKKVYGVGLKEYISDSKMRLAKDLLLTTDMSIKQVARALRYEEENLFIKFFIYHEKISPAAFKARYCNTHINYK